MSAPVVHITTQGAWAEAQAAGQYTAPSLQTQGFIHCSAPTEGQLIAVANFLYRGQPGLVLLLIDPARLNSELRWEEFEPGSQHFPHLYGPLNLDAVLDVLDFLPEADGLFRLPTQLRQLL